MFALHFTFDCRWWSFCLNFYHHIFSSWLCSWLSFSRFSPRFSFWFIDWFSSSSLSWMLLLWETMMIDDLDMRKHANDKLTTRLSSRKWFSRTVNRIFLKEMMLYKVNRCLARYSPRGPNHQLTHQQGTKWASNGQKCQFRAKFGRFWAKNPFFYWRNQKFCYPHNGKPT